MVIPAREGLGLVKVICSTLLGDRSRGLKTFHISSHHIQVRSAIHSKNRAELYLTQHAMNMHQTWRIFAKRAFCLSHVTLTCTKCEPSCSPYEHESLRKLACKWSQFQFSMSLSSLLWKFENSYLQGKVLSRSLVKIFSLCNRQQERKWRKKKWKLNSIRSSSSRDDMKVLSFTSLFITP